MHLIACTAAAVCASSIFNTSLLGQSVNSRETVTPDTEEVQLPAFRVVSTKDEGYYAQNSMTATKFSSAAQDTPLAINIYTSDFMKDIGAIEVADVLRYTPSVNAYRSGFQDDTTYTIRGFAGAANVQLRNGIRKSGLLDSAGQERLEVVMGPTAVISGQMSPGGLFNVIMKRPLESFHANFSESVGSFGFSRSVLDVTGPIFEKKAGWSAYFRLVGADTFNGDFRRFASMKKQYIYPIVVLKNELGTQFTIDTEFSELRGQPGVSVPWVQPAGTNYRMPAPLPYDFNPATQETGNFYRSGNTIFDLRQVVNEHIILQANSQYQVRERDNYQYGGVKVDPTLKLIQPGGLLRIDQNNYNQNYFASAIIKYNLGPIEAQTVAGHEFYRGPFSLRFYQSPLANPVWSVTDPSTWNHTVSYLPTMVLQGGANGTRVHQVSSDRAETLANSFNYKKRIYVSVSARADEIRYSSQRLNVDGSQYSWSEFTNHHISPMLGALVRVTPSFALYYDASGSFVANTTGARGADGQFETLKPTIGKGNEVGLKAALFEGKLSTNVAVFRDDQTNAPYTVTLPDPLNSGGNFTATLQSGLTRTQGVEINLSGKVTRRLTLVAGYSYLDSHILSNPGNRTLEGLRTVATPRNKVSLLARYGSVKLPFGSLYATAGYIYQSDMQGSGDLVRTILPSFSTVAASLNWHLKIKKYSLDARFAVDNAFDRQYWYTTQIPAKPRSYMGMLSLGF